MEVGGGEEVDLGSSTFQQGGAVKRTRRRAAKLLGVGRRGLEVNISRLSIDRVSKKNAKREERGRKLELVALSFSPQLLLFDLEPRAGLDRTQNSLPLSAVYV